MASTIWISPYTASLPLDVAVEGGDDLDGRGRLSRSEKKSRKAVQKLGLTVSKLIGLRLFSLSFFHPYLEYKH